MELKVKREINKAGSPLIDETRIFEAKWFSWLIDQWVDAKYLGYKAIQIHNVTENGHLILSKINEKYLIPERKEWKENVYDIKGPSYDEDFYINYLIEIGNNVDLGLFKGLAPIVLWKRFAMQNWATYQEKFGNPIVSIQTNTVKPEEIKKLEEWGKNLGAAGYMISKKGQELVEFLQAQKPDAYAVFKEMIQLCNAEISKLIHGADIHDSNGGSFAKNKINDHQADIKSISDLREIEYFVNEYLMPKMKNLGVNIPDDCYFKFDKNQKLDLTA